MLTKVQKRKLLLGRVFKAQSMAWGFTNVSDAKRAVKPGFRVAQEYIDLLKAY